ncbi:hypothetical protein KNT58_gp61 [Mycobacterium phage Fortunato]|uniref:Uncharacterized protein n=1 Tax=Mycobacterium phage Fortunato TaxID=1882439 RepID=A0A1D8EYG8_9CAUD|nr:hypothetical protein KNT58_gp61 [Mycobacterium phage Fortunato]AOT27278.1 hypothetical protein SEA_FORTUNATO_61 [Mycobacterium phage Fortunato]
MAAECFRVSVNAMTTTTRKTTKKAQPPKGDVRSETLAQFNRELIEYGGYDPGFDGLVETLYATREAIRQLAGARKNLFEHIKGYHRGADVAVPGTEYVVRQTEAGPATTYRAVSSAAAKKADPAAWRRAQVLTGFVQVKAPAAVAAAVPVEDVPALCHLEKGVGLTEAVAAYKDAPAWARLKELRAVESETLGRLEKLAAEFGWDGDLKVFADGWSVQLKRVQYSSDALAVVDPELFDRLAEVKLRQAAPRVYIGKPGDTDGAEDADAD